MSEPKWTPGPWRIEQRAADERWIMAGDMLMAVAYLDDPEDQEGDANAHLIAAAPDLYEAVRRLVETFEQIVPLNPDQVDYDAYKLAVEALRKARGEAND